jgi:hypothetical protein
MVVFPAIIVEILEEKLLQEPNSTQNKTLQSTKKIILKADGSVLPSPFFSFLSTITCYFSSLQHSSRRGWRKKKLLQSNGF